MLLKEVDALREELRELRGVIRNGSSDCEQSRNVAGSRASSHQPTIESSDGDVGVANAKKLSSLNSGSSYSEVVRGGKSDAHSSTKESKEMSKINRPNPRRNHPSTRHQRRQRTS